MLPSFYESETAMYLYLELISYGYERFNVSPGTYITEDDMHHACLICSCIANNFEPIAS